MTRRKTKSSKSGFHAAVDGIDRLTRKMTASAAGRGLCLNGDDDGKNRRKRAPSAVNPCIHDEGDGNGAVQKRSWGKVSFIFVPLILLAALFFAEALPAEVLDFDTLAGKASSHSYDMRMADLDIRISRSGLEEALSARYPRAWARFDTVHTKDLTGGTPRAASIGDMIFEEETLFQNAFSVGLTYDLYDFGARGRKLFIAGRDVDLRKALYDRTLREARLKVLNIYSDLLLEWKAREAENRRLSVFRELATVMKRLHEAGGASRMEMADAALNVVKTLDALDASRIRLVRLLRELSLHTGEAYDSEALEIRDLDGDSLHPNGSASVSSAEERIYGIAREQKRAEIEVLERERCPKIALKSYYAWYGQDMDSYRESLGDLRSKNFFVGLSLTLPLFDGFRTGARIDKAKLELERLEIEREKKLAELRSRREALAGEAVLYEEEEGKCRDMVTAMEEKFHMVERLREKELASRADFLKEKLVLIAGHLELDKVLVRKASALKELGLLAEGGN